MAKITSHGRSGGFDVDIGCQCSRSGLDRRFWRIVPFGDHALLFPNVIAVMDDFGTLVRVGEE